MGIITHHSKFFLVSESLYKAGIYIIGADNSCLGCCYYKHTPHISRNVWNQVITELISLPSSFYSWWESQTWTQMTRKDLYMITNNLSFFLPTNCVAMKIIPWTGWISNLKLISSSVIPTYDDIMTYKRQHIYQ